MNDLMPYLAMLATWVAGYYSKGVFDRKREKLTVSEETAKNNSSITDTYLELFQKMKKEILDLHNEQLKSQDKISELMLKNKNLLSQLLALKGRCEKLEKKVKELSDEKALCLKNISLQK